MTEPYNPEKKPLTPRETELLIITLQCLVDSDIKVFLSPPPQTESTITLSVPFLDPTLTDPIGISTGATSASASPKKRSASKPKTDSNAQDEDGEGAALICSPKKRGKKEQDGKKAGKRVKKSEVKVEVDGNGTGEANEGAEVVKQEMEV
ncbi:MAG: hypothetical protein Q9221_001076 [Calogaya cf. arnoldii]